MGIDTTLLLLHFNISYFDLRQPCAVCMMSILIMILLYLFILQRTDGAAPSPQHGRHRRSPAPPEPRTGPHPAARGGIYVFPLILKVLNVCYILIIWSDTFDEGRVKRLR